MIQKRGWLDLRSTAKWMELRLAGPNFKWVGAILFIAVLALGSWTRLPNLDQPPLWDDERFSLIGAAGQTASLPYNIDNVTVEQIQLMWTPDIPGLRTGFTPADVWAKNNLGNIFRAIGFFDGSNGLLFNLVLHYWIDLVELDDVSLRLLPVLLGIATLATIFLGLRAVGAGLLEATLAASIAAGHPLLIWSSRELRSYALATLFVVASTFLLLRIVQACEAGRSVRWLVPFYIAGAAGALMSHYFTAYILCGHVIWAVLAVRNRRAWLYLILAGVIVSGAFVAWLLTGAADGIKLMDAHNALWIQRAHAGPFPDLTTLDRLRSALLIAFVQHVMLQPIQAYESIFVRLLPGPAVTLGWALFTAALLLLAASNLRDVLRRNDWRERLRLLMLILAAMGPLMAGALALKSGHMLSFLHRYMVFSAPFAAIFLALCAATLVDRAASSRSAALVSLPLLTVMLVMTGIYLQAPDRFMRPPDPRGDIYFEAAGRVAEVAQPADLVVYGNAFDALMVSLYLRNRPGLRSVVEDHDDPLSRPAVMLRRGNSEIKLVDILYLGEPP